jgi:hypothetical protein
MSFIVFVRNNHNQAYIFQLSILIHALSSQCFIFISETNCIHDLCITEFKKTIPHKEENRAILTTARRPTKIENDTCVYPVIIEK